MYQLIFSPPFSSWSLRPWILLKTLNIPFEPKILPYLADPAEKKQLFAQHSPTALVPALIDGELLIWDSLAIVEYVAEAYPQVWAEEKTARAWSRSACAEMHSGFSQLREICNFEPFERKPLSDIPATLEQEIMRLNALFNEGLSRFGGEFLAGNRFTAVDAFFAPVVIGRIESYGLHRYFSQAAQGYFQRIITLAAVAEWKTLK